MSDYTVEAQQRILRLILTLSGHEMDGLAPSAIAKLQNCSKSMVTRDLANLLEAGFAEHVPHTGGWRLSPSLVQIAVRMQSTLALAAERIQSNQQRYTRT